MGEIQGHKTEREISIDNLIFIPVSLTTLLNEIQAIVEAAIKADKSNQFEEKLISPAEACKMFQPTISKPTLTAWARSGHLHSKKIGGRVFYNKGQILEAGKTLQRYKKISSSFSVRQEINLN